MWKASPTFKTRAKHTFSRARAPQRIVCVPACRLLLRHFGFSHNHAPCAHARTTPQLLRRAGRRPVDSRIFRSSTWCGKERVTGFHNTSETYLFAGTRPAATCMRARVPSAFAAFPTTTLLVRAPARYHSSCAGQGVGLYIRVFLEVAPCVERVTNFQNTSETYLFAGTRPAANCMRAR